MIVNCKLAGQIQRVEEGEGCISGEKYRETKNDEWSQSMEEEAVSLLSSREQELLGVINKLEAALRRKGASEDELAVLLDGLLRPLPDNKPEEKDEDEERQKPMWARAKFVANWSEDFEVESRIAAVANFQQTYLDLPRVEIRYEDVKFVAKIDASAPKIETVANANPLGAIATKVAYKLSGKKTMVTRTILDCKQGVLSPGTMTLVLGAPGCGKTSYLKLLAGLLQKKSGSSTLTYEQCSYNGEDVYEKPSFVANKVSVYINQVDIHTPTLTVAETFQFAFETMGAGDALGTTEHKRELFRQETKKAGTLMQSQREGEADEYAAFVEASGRLKINSVMQILGIDHVKDTIVGNAAIRGVSGGQRRRVSIGEMMMGKARLICGDEITTGLDSQTTFEITRALKISAKHLGLTIALSLLQPPPESFALFDNVVLLDKGTVAYHGPTTTIQTFFESIGIAPPPLKDVADFLVEVTSSIELAKEYCTVGRPGNDVFDYSARYLETDYAKTIRAQLDAEATAYKWGPYYSKEFTEPISYYMKACLRRQILEVQKNSAYLKTRFGQAIAMGIFTGTLYWDLDYDDFGSKYGFLFSTLLYLGLSGMSSIPGLIDRRDVFYKQRDQAFFPTAAYTLSLVVVDTVVTVAETVVYTVLVYFPTGLAYPAFGIYFVICLLIGLSMSQWFSVIAAIAPTTQDAQPAAGMSVVLCVLFSGFIVQRNNIPNAWRPLYWASPISVGWRALSINEFRSDTYDKCVYQVDTYDDCTEENPCCRANHDGLIFLRSYAVQHDTIFILWAIVQLAGYFVFDIFLMTFVLSHVRHGGHGAAPDVADDDIVQEAESLTAHPFKTASVKILPDTGADFAPTPTTIAFDDVHYTVMVSSKGAHSAPEPLELLGGVTGYAKPATMTALMGSSGAGKTTLLDVLAGRKKTGKVEGKITLNGHDIDPITFARISGYVEQLDVHNPGPTVHEAVEFSAAMRLSPEYQGRRAAFCEQILSLLELNNIKDNQVGTIASGGCSFEQRKRLTMAVELAANPAILFLDGASFRVDLFDFLWRRTDERPRRSRCARRDPRDAQHRRHGTLRHLHHSPAFLCLVLDFRPPPLAQARRPHRVLWRPRREVPDSRRVPRDDHRQDEDGRNRTHHPGGRQPRHVDALLLRHQRRRLCERVLRQRTRQAQRRRDEESLGTARRLRAAAIRQPLRRVALHAVHHPPQAPLYLVLARTRLQRRPRHGLDHHRRDLRLVLPAKTTQRPRREFRSPWSDRPLLPRHVLYGYALVSDCSSHSFSSQVSSSSRRHSRKWPSSARPTTASAPAACTTRSRTRSRSAWPRRPTSSLSLFSTRASCGASWTCTRASTASSSTGRTTCSTFRGPLSSLSSSSPLSPTKRPRRRSERPG